MAEPFDTFEPPRPVRDRGAKKPARALLLGLLAIGGGAALIARAPPLRGLWGAVMQRLNAAAPDPMVQRELQLGEAALHEASGRALRQAQTHFVQANRMDATTAAAQVGLAQTQLAMAEALLDASDDMVRLTARLSRKERRRAERDAQQMRAEAAVWQAQAQPAAYAAVQLLPQAAGPNCAMAELLRQQGAVEQAKGWLARIPTGEAKGPQFLAASAALQATSSPAAARHTLAQAVQAAPDDNRLRYRLAHLLLDAGERDAAVEHVHAILARAPEHELAQQMLMRLEPAASAADRVVHPVVLSFRDPEGQPAAWGGPGREAAVQRPEPAAAALQAAGADAQQAAAPDAVADGGAAAAARAWLLQARRAVQGGVAVARGLWGGQPAAPAASAEPAPLPAAADVSMQAAPPAAADAHALPPASAAPIAPKLTNAQPQPPPADHAAAPAQPPAPVTLSADVQRMAPPALLEHAQALRQAGHDADAVAVLQLAVQRSPLDADSRVALGDCQLALHDVQAAQASFAQAVRLMPWRAAPHVGLAEALQQAGQVREARDHARRALAIEPNGPQAAVARQMLEDLSK